MLARVQVPTLLGLVELGTDREGRAIPPKAPEDVGRAGLLAQPARRGDVGPARGELETSLSLVRDRLISLQAHGPRIASAVPAFTVGHERQTFHCVAKSSPAT